MGETAETILLIIGLILLVAAIFWVLWIFRWVIVALVGICVLGALGTALVQRGRRDG